MQATDFTAAELDAMRAWVDDTLGEGLQDYWARSGLDDDPDFTIDDLANEDVLILVANNYDGGIGRFLKDIS